MPAAQRLKNSKRKLQPGELLFKYSAYWRTWNRVDRWTFLTVSGQWSKLI